MNFCLKLTKMTLDLSNLHKTTRTSDNFILDCIGKNIVLLSSVPGFTSARSWLHKLHHYCRQLNDSYAVQRTMLAFFHYQTIAFVSSFI